MPKQIIKFLNDLSPSEYKLRDLPRRPDGLYNLAFDEYSNLVKRAGYTEYNTNAIGSSTTLTGTVAINKSSTAVVGTGTEFTTELAVGDLIKIIEEIFTVSVITDDTNLTLDSAYQGANDSGVTAYQLHKIVGMHRLYKRNTAEKEFILAWNTSLYKLPDTGEHTPAALTDCPDLAGDADTYFADFADHCYIVNGVNSMMKYNMANVRTVGITIPAAPTFVNNTIVGGLEGGTYYFKVTYVDEDLYESNGGAALGATGVNDKGIRISIPQSNDAKVDERRIYRTTVGGSIYYFDGKVENNDADETYDSDISDEEISLKSVLHIDHNAPPGAPSLVVKRLSRVNIAVDDDLYVSKNYDKTTGVRSVEYFPPYNYFPTGNGQNITGLMEQLGGLPVFTENTIERLVGTDEGNFEYRNAHQEDGCIAKRSVVNCKNYVVYLAFNGIYIFDGVSARAIDVAFGGRLNKYIRENINYSCAHLSCATYYDNKYLLCIPTGESAVPNITIYYDFSTGKYGVYSFAFSCFSKWDKGGDGLSLKGGSNTIGRVYEIGGTILTDYNESTEEDDDITAYDEIEPIDFGRPEVYKQFYSIFIKIKSTTGTAFRLYYTLDNGTETYVDKTLTADTTKWYRIGLGEGGKCAREFKPRPYMSDKFYFEIHGLAICYDEESFSEERE
ncbi:hypothetical protein ES705_24089 [subsurface metagenome]